MDRENLLKQILYTGNEVEAKEGTKVLAWQMMRNLGTLDEEEQIVKVEKYFMEMENLVLRTTLMKILATTDIDLGHSKRGLDQLIFQEIARGLLTRLCPALHQRNVLQTISRKRAFCRYKQTLYRRSVKKAISTLTR